MDRQQQAVQNAVLRINGRAWGWATGFLLAFGLFAATNILVMRGGVNVGHHLQLLRIYFPGYSVSFVGSLIGFMYAFVVGYGLGRIIGSVYNLVVGVTD
jgi:hypothetical protein